MLEPHSVRTGTVLTILALATFAVTAALDRCPRAERGKQRVVGVGTSAP